MGASAGTGALPELRDIGQRADSRLNQAAAPARLVHPVELDEIDGGLGLVGVGHAVAQPRADEGQVRVAVPGLHLLLGLVQLQPEVHLVVTIGGVLGEDGAEGLQEGAQALLVVGEAGGQGAVEVACGGVQGGIEGLTTALERSLRLQVEASPDDVAVLMPTSGTTGRSKLVMQTHRAYALAGEGFPYWMGLEREDRLMTSLPLFHLNAIAYSVLGSLACGAGLVLLPRFSASGFLDSARRHGATEFNAIGAMLEILMRRPERAR